MADYLNKDYQMRQYFLKWEMADYLMGQYFLLPKRMEGHPVYKQAETVGKENFFLFRERSRWYFSHILGASDGRYPSTCVQQNPGLPPKEWKIKKNDIIGDNILRDEDTILKILKLRNEDIILKTLIPAELKFCQSVVIGANEKVSDKVLKCLGTFHLMEGVWSCGKPVYKGPKDYVLMVTGKLWGVKPKLESWGEVVLRAKEASMGPAGGAPWMSRNLELGVWKECDVTVTELD